jgi:hypothetical protein
MFSLAEKGKRTQDALSYNTLTTSWSDAYHNRGDG